MEVLNLWDNFQGNVMNKKEVHSNGVFEEIITRKKEFINIT